MSTRSRSFVALSVLVLAVATLVRLPAITAALPYTSYIDESHYLRQPAHMVADDTWSAGDYLNPYSHPTLPYDLIAITTEIYARAGHPAVETGVRATEDSPYYDIIAPAELIVVGRLLELLASLGTVVVTILLGRRLGGRRVGLAAGAMVALLPVLVRYAGLAVVDSLVMFVTVATLLIAVHALDAAGRRATMLVVAAGVGAGLCFTAKYPAGAVILSVVAVAYLRDDWTRRTKVRRVLLACGAGAITALIVMPAFVLRPLPVFHDMGHEAVVYKGKAGGHYWRWLLDSGEIGALFTVLALVGLVLLVRSPRTRRPTLVVFGYLVPTAAFLFIAPYQPVRNLMPLLPVLAVAAAVTVVTGARALPVPRWGRDLVAAGVVGLVLVLAVTGGVRPDLEQVSKLVDSRVRAVDWLDEHGSDGDRVLVAEELALVPSELARIPGQVTVAPASGDDGPDPADFDVVVTGDLAAKEGDDGETAWVPPGEPEPAATFGGRPTEIAPTSWRTNNELIRVYRLAPS